jgi:hypothetical protein
MVHGMAAALEEIPDVGGDVALVLDHEDAHAGRVGAGHGVWASGVWAGMRPAD